MRQLGKDMAQGVRATAVLVATLIGAGYATGREVSQYFGRADTLTLVCSAVLMGLLSMLFMYVGRVGGEPHGRLITLYRVLLSLAAVVSCGVMLSAGRTLLSGRWTAILLGCAGVLLGLQRRVFHAANLVAVPVLLLLVVVAYCGAPHLADGVSFLPLSAANYAGMNLLFEGELLRSEGKDMSPRAIVFAGVGVTACMCVLLVLMHRMVGSSPASLPFAEVCALQGRSGVVKGVILAAILTNIAGCIRLVADTGSRVMPLSVVALGSLLVSLWVAMVSFAALVRYVYPVLGWMGVAVGAGYALWALGLWCFSQKRGIRRPWPLRPQSALFRHRVAH